MVDLADGYRTSTCAYVDQYLYKGTVYIGC